MNELHESASLEIDRRLMLARLPIASLTCPDISNSLANTNHRRSKTPNSANPNDEKYDNRTDFVETSCPGTDASKYRFCVCSLGWFRTFFKAITLQCHGKPDPIWVSKSYLESLRSQVETLRIIPLCGNIHCLEQIIS